MLVDIAMPEMNGLDLTRAVKALPVPPEPPKVIIVTLYDTPTYREAARAAGADGFLGKSRLGEGLQQAIAQVLPSVHGLRME
jgi:DNA-binding NarL/FixJ family response regulator